MNQLNPTRRNIITGALMAATFSAAVEVTIVNAAMPTVVGALGGISLYSWVFSAFMLANTLTVPLYGKLADLYGRKKVFITAVLLFVIGSALCGFSQSMGQLVFFRAIQGMGAGGVLPVTLTIVGDIFPFELRARAQGWFSSMWGLAAIVGPFIGGWTVEYLSWHWIFWFNLPLGILIVLTIAIFLKEQIHEGEKSIDYGGAVLFSLAVLGILAFTQLIGNNEAGHPLPWALLVSGVVLLVFFYRWEQRVKDPFVPLALFRNPIIASSNLSAFLTGMGMFGAINFVPLFVQGILGKSPTLAGLAITPQVLGWSACSVVAGRWLLKQGYRPPIVTGTVLISLSALSFILMNADTPYVFILVSMFVLGCGLGLSMTTYIVAVQNAVSSNERGSATSSQMFSRSMGGACGVTLMGAILSFRLKDEITTYITAHKDELSRKTIQQLEQAQGVTQSEGLATLPEEVAQRVSTFLAQSLDTVFLTAALFSIAALVVAWLLVPKGSASSLSAKE